MSAIETTSIQSANTAIPASQSGPVRGIFSALAMILLRAGRRWQRNRAINELSMLDNRQLADIGITRNDIPRVVDGLLGPEEVRSNRPPKSAASEDAIVAAASYKRAA